MTFKISVDEAFEYFGVPKDRRTISSQLAYVAKKRPNELAVSDGTRQMTWHEVDEAASAFAQQLRGYKRVAAIAGPTLEMLLVMYGCARAHVAYCPMPTPYTAVELKAAFERLSVDAVFATEPFDARLTEAGFGPDRLRRVTPDWKARAPTFVTPGRSTEDVAWIIWTSGSTAQPKAVLVPERAPLLAGFAYTREMNTGPKDKWLNFMPFFHLSGTWLSMHALAAECSNRLMPNGFEPHEALKAIMEEGVSRFGGFELFWRRMQALPEWKDADLSGLTAVNVPGNPNLYEMVDGLGIPLITLIYGLSEAGLACLTRHDDTDREARKHSNGHPTHGTEIRIVDIDTKKDVPLGERGEIWTRGPYQSLGYLDGVDPAGVFDAEGWVHSGDLGHLDKEGRLYFRGRVKHMVKSGGENVSCLEVEVAVQNLCEGVLAAQIVGTPDPEWGEAVIAFIEMHPDTAFNPDKIKDVLKKNLAPFKIPKEYIQIQTGQWPMTGSGKVQRGDLEKVAATVRAATLAAR